MIEAGFRIFCAYHNTAVLVVNGYKLPTEFLSQPEMTEEMVLGWQWCFNNHGVLQKAGINLKLRDLEHQESVGNSPVAETTITESSENSSQLATAAFTLPGVNAIFAEDKQLSADMGTWSNLSTDTARILTNAWENEQQGLDDVLSQVEKLDRDDLEEGASRHVVQALDGLPSAEYLTRCHSGDIQTTGSAYA